jgi:hypothetical protein
MQRVRTSPDRPARLAPPDVDVLRAGLAQGKIVRVGIAPSDQFPAGVTGRVRRIGDAAVDGDEFVFVEVPVGGAKDVLPFAATDLTAPPRRGSARSEPRAPTRSRATPASYPAQLSDTPPVAPRSLSDTPPVSGGSAAKNPGRAAAGSRGRRAPVTITISTAGGESAAWAIEAKVGARTTIRPTTISPTRVWEMVQSLGDPELTEIVQSHLHDHRRSIQARADAVAAELSALQAELESYPGAPSDLNRADFGKPVRFQAQHPEKHGQ